MAIDVRKGQGPPPLDRAEFSRRFPSHAALDRDTAVQEEVRNVARAVANKVGPLRRREMPAGHAGLKDPRPK